MSEKTKPASNKIEVTSNETVQAPSAAKIASEVTEIGTTIIETFTGLQPGVNFVIPAEAPAAPAAPEAAE